MNKNCTHCQFVWKDHPLPNQPEVMICRRFPPQMFSVMVPSNIAGAPPKASVQVRFPMVVDTMWCHEFAPAIETSLAPLRPDA